MRKNCIKVVNIALNDYTKLIGNEHSVFNGIALIHETLTDLGYHVLNRHIVYGDEATLYPVKTFIHTTLVAQSSGISTDTQVSVRPASPGCYAVMFFK